MLKKSNELPTGKISRLFCVGLGMFLLVSWTLPDLRGQETIDSKPITTQEVAPVIWSADDPNQDARWEFKDPASWRFAVVDEVRVLSQFHKASDYRPPYRSPLHIALLKDEVFESFQMDCWVKSTHPEYGHRDVCFFFGYAAPDQFYYVHLASEMDDHANQIFRVNQADRIKISQTTTSGTRWDDQWHQVRIQRDIATQRISVYFDDLEKPIMTAECATITSGQLGFGSFDDTADFKRLEIRRK